MAPQHAAPSQNSRLPTDSNSRRDFDRLRACHATQNEGIPQLASITDVIGITSSFTYSANGVNLITPYGTSEFTFGEATSPANTLRWLDMKGPLGHTERLEFNQPATSGIGPVPSTDPSGTVPTGTLPGTPNNSNQRMQWRNTFYWDKEAYPLWYGFDDPATPDVKEGYLKAKRFHWLHSPSAVVPILESVKNPLENRVWFRYAGLQKSFDAGTNAFPIYIGRVLDDGTSQVWAASYNSIGNPLTKTDPLGRRTRFSYAPNGFDLLAVEQRVSISPEVYTPVATYTYNSQHLPLTVTDAANKIWQYTYEPDGQLSTMRDPLGALMETRQYDAVGRLTAILNGNGISQYTFIYDPESTCQALHKNCDLPTQIVDSAGRSVTYVRDALDRVTYVNYPDQTHDDFTYAHLDMDSFRDRLGRSTMYTYDAERRLTSVMDPLNHEVSYTYFRNGALKTLTDEEDNVTTWTVDVQGRPIQKEYADATRINYTYEATTSRLRWVTPPSSTGWHKEYTYNRDDSLAGVQYDGSPNPTPGVTFAYDPWFPRRTSMTDGIGTTAWTFVPPGSNGAHQVQVENGPFTYDSVTYGYDQLGRPINMAVGDGPAAPPPETWHYDAAGRVDQHGTNLGDFTYTYLAQTEMPLVRSLPPSGPSTTWNYDSAANGSRLMSIATTGARTITLTHSRYPQGDQDPYQVRSLISAAGGAVPGMAAAKQCYQYDDARRLVGASAPSQPTGDCSEPLGSQTSLHSYVLDAAGNATASTDHGVNTDVFVNSLNQVTGMYTPSTGQGRNFGYDTEGNQTSETGPGAPTRSFKWDAESRVIEIADPDLPGSPVYAFRYDGLGRRVEVTHSNTSGMVSKSRFIWCGETLCAKHDGQLIDTMLARYFDEGQFNPQSGQQWLAATDHLGSTRDVIDLGTGAVMGSFDYTPYGKVAGFTGTAVPDFLYAGLYHDASTGFDYSKTRLYDPTLGRWTSRDPLGEFWEVVLKTNPGFMPFAFAGGLYDADAGLLRSEALAWTARHPQLLRSAEPNLYEYVNGDPINYVDPTGEFWQWVAAGMCLVYSWVWVNEAINDPMHGNPNIPKGAPRGPNPGGLPGVPVAPAPTPQRPPPSGAGR